MNLACFSVVMANISIWQLSQYIGNRKRCAIEGQAVLDAGHLISCGVINEEGEVAIKALCVRSSSVQDSPHELHAVLARRHFRCNARAKQGYQLSETCKRCIALLTHIHQ